MTHAYLAQSRIESPLGPLTLAATARGLAGVWFDGQDHHPLQLQAPVDATHPLLVRAAAELAAYWADAGHRFLLPLDPQGSDFQQAVWRALLEIAPGARSTYGAVAQRIGRPDAVRAVGGAIGRNPIGIIVPCHRVVGKDGTLTGYAGGLPRKQALLQHEEALRQPVLV